MTEDEGVARSWLEGLAARGVTVTVTNGRLRMLPSTAYKSLTDDELITLRHHRAAIKAVINAGVSFDVVRAAPSVAHVTPEPEPVCPRCYQSPCIGVEHPAFYALHPIEAHQRAGDERTKEMMARIGKPYPWSDE